MMTTMRRTTKRRRGSTFSVYKSSPSIPLFTILRLGYSHGALSTLQLSFSFWGGQRNSVKTFQFGWLQGTSWWATRILFLVFKSVTLLISSLFLVFVKRKINFFRSPKISTDSSVRRGGRRRRRTARRKRVIHQKPNLSFASSPYFTNQVILIVFFHCFPITPSSFLINWKQNIAVRIRLTCQHCFGKHC